jgi:hypothetical protein
MPKSVDLPIKVKNRNLFRGSKGFKRLKIDFRSSVKNNFDLLLGVLKFDLLTHTHICGIRTHATIPIIFFTIFAHMLLIQMNGA